MEQGGEGAQVDGAPQDQFDPADAEELQALGKIVHAFREYRTAAESEIERWQHNFSR